MNLRCDSMWNTGKENQKRELSTNFQFSGKKIQTQVFELYITLNKI